MVFQLLHYLYKLNPIVSKAQVICDYAFFNMSGGWNYRKLNHLAATADVQDWWLERALEQIEPRSLNPKSRPRTPYPKLKVLDWGP